ncbi:hypothetical protein CSUI_002741 [Cystoisospora suis]|uniref:Sfi1 spindle body domain-containing protein n=1 Tax=Cystoisospora suis TaxID=483139 RepID=A0A2C6L7N4_9APIC|nr:hypothetical protein CSUI_002741 [Cystoisospora suis]
MTPYASRSLYQGTDTSESCLFLFTAGQKLNAKAGYRVGGEIQKSRLRKVLPASSPSVSTQLPYTIPNFLATPSPVAASPRPLLSASSSSVSEACSGLDINCTEVGGEHSTTPGGRAERESEDGGGVRGDSSPPALSSLSSIFSPCPSDDSVVIQGGKASGDLRQGRKHDVSEGEQHRHELEGDDDVPSSMAREVCRPFNEGIVSPTFGTRVPGKEEASAFAGEASLTMSDACPQSSSDGAKVSVPQADILCEGQVIPSSTGISPFYPLPRAEGRRASLDSSRVPVSLFSPPPPAAPSNALSPVRIFAESASEPGCFTSALQASCSPSSSLSGPWGCPGCPLSTVHLLPCHRAAADSPALRNASSLCSADVRCPQHHHQSPVQDLVSPPLSAPCPHAALSCNRCASPRETATDTVFFIPKSALPPPSSSYLPFTLADSSTGFVPLHPPPTSSPPSGGNTPMRPCQSQGQHSSPGGGAPHGGNQGMVFGSVSRGEAPERRPESCSAAATDVRNVQSRVAFSREGLNRSALAPFSAGPPRLTPALDWSDGQILCAAAAAAAEEHHRQFGSRFENGAGGSTSPSISTSTEGGLPFLLVRKHLVALLDCLGVGLQSVRGVRLYRMLIQQAGTGSMVNTGPPMPVATREHRGAQVSDKGCYASANIFVGDGEANDEAKTSGADREAAAARESETAQFEANRVELGHGRDGDWTAWGASPSKGTPAAQQRAMPARSGEARRTVPLPASLVSCAEVAVTRCAKNLHADEKRYEEVEKRLRKTASHRLAVRVLRAWHEAVERRLHSAAAALQIEAASRRRRLGQLLALWKEAADSSRRFRREAEQKLLAEAFRERALARQALSMWKSATAVQREDESERAAMFAARRILGFCFRWWQASVAHQVRERELRVKKRILKAWTEKVLPAQRRKQSLGLRYERFVAHRRKQQMRRVLIFCLKTVREGQVRAQQASVHARRSVLRRSLRAWHWEVAARMESRVSSIECAEAVRRERLLARAFSGWKKATALSWPRFGPAPQMPVSQVLCVLRAVAYLGQRVGDDWQRDRPRSLQESLAEAVTRKAKRRSFERGGGAGGGGEAQDGGRLRTDAPMLGFVFVGGTEIHHTKLAQAAPHILHCVREHVRRHCFLQWWAIAQARKAFRVRVEKRLLAETMHAWQSLPEQRRIEEQKSNELRKRQCRRLLESCWKQWKKRWLRYVTFRAQCRGLQDTRVRHLLVTAFRSWTLYTEQRREEQARVAQVQVASNRCRQRASLSAWREALHFKRREAAMDEAAKLLRQRSLLRKAMRGLFRQRNSARLLKSATQALKHERLSLFLSLWWRWAACRAAVSELTALQQSKTRKRKQDAIWRAWRLLFQQRIAQRAAVRTLETAERKHGLRVAWQAWEEHIRRHREKQRAAGLLVARLRKVACSVGFESWRLFGHLEKNEEWIARRHKLRLMGKVFEAWRCAVAEHATCQLHLRGQLLCAKLSRLLRRWHRFAYLSRIRSVLENHSRLSLLRRVQTAWLHQLREIYLERHAEQRADALHRSLGLRMASRCFLAWKDIVRQSAAVRSKGETVLLRHELEEVKWFFGRWRDGLGERRRFRAAVEKLDIIRRRHLQRQVVERWYGNIRSLVMELKAVYFRREMLMRQCVQQWMQWTGERRARKWRYQAAVTFLDRPGGSRRNAEKEEKRMIFTTWRSLSVRWQRVTTALIRLEGLRKVLFLRQVIHEWRVKARRDTQVELGTLILLRLLQRRMLRDGWKGLRSHHQRLDVLEISSQAFQEQLSRRLTSKSFGAWHGATLARRHAAREAQLHREQEQRAESFDRVSQLRKFFLGWLQVLASKLQMQQRLFLLVKKQHSRIQQDVLRSWRHHCLRKQRLREAAVEYAASRRIRELRKVFHFLFSTATRQRTLRARLLFCLGLLVCEEPPFETVAWTTISASGFLQSPSQEQQQLEMLLGRPLPPPSRSEVGALDLGDSDKHGLSSSVGNHAELSAGSRTSDAHVVRRRHGTFETLPLVPRLIVWAAQPHMLQLLLLQPAISSGLAGSVSGVAPSQGVLPRSGRNKQVPHGGRSHSSISLRKGREPFDSHYRSVLSPGGVGFGGAAQTPSTCTPHTSRTGTPFDALPAARGFDKVSPFLLESEGSTPLLPVVSHVRMPRTRGEEWWVRRARSASSGDRHIPEVPGRRERGRDPFGDQGVGLDDLLLGDNKSSSGLHSLLRCYNCEETQSSGEAGIDTGLQDSHSSSPRLRGLLLSFCKPRRRKTFTGSEDGDVYSTDAGSGGGLNSSTSSPTPPDTPTSADGGLDGYAHVKRQPWQDQIPLELLASAWGFAHLLLRGLKVWHLHARAHTQRRLREGCIVNNFRTHQKRRLLSSSWQAWRLLKETENTRATVLRQALLSQKRKRAFLAWFTRSRIDPVAFAGAQALCQRRKTIVLHASFCLWRSTAIRLKQEATAVATLEHSVATRWKEHIFRLWIHLSKTSRVGRQLYLQHTGSVLRQTMAVWTRVCQRRQSVKRLGETLSKPLQRLGLFHLRLWAFTHARGTRVLIGCMAEWRSFADRRKKLRGLMVYVQTLRKVYLLQQHFAAWLVIQRRQRRLMILQQTAAAASVLLPLHRCFLLWRSVARERQERRDQLLQQYLQQERIWLRLSSQQHPETGESQGRVGANWCWFWRVREAWGIWRRRFRLRKLLRTRATRCAKVCLAAFKQAVARRRALEALESKRRTLLVQRVVVAWQVYVQRRLLKQQRMAHAVERHQKEALRWFFGQWRWLQQRYQWERAVQEVVQAKINRRLGRAALRALKGHALDRAIERERVQEIQESSSRRTVRIHFASWQTVWQAVRHHGDTVIKKTWTAWRKQLKLRQGLQVLEMMQQHVHERQARQCLLSFQDEVCRFQAMQALGTEMPWLAASLQGKVDSVHSMVTAALEGFRTYAAARVSRRRQKRLLSAAFSSWTKLQETEQPYRLLLRCFHHWRGAWQYRLHLQAAQVAVSRHVELKMKRHAWDSWVLQYKEEERGRLLMKQAEQLRVQWGIEKGLLVLHEHRLQREWMSWCMYRAEVFLEEKQKEKALLCWRSWRLWTLQQAQRHATVARVQARSRLWLLSSVFSAFRDLFSKSVRVRMCAEQVQRATKRYRLRAAWLAWRAVYKRLVDLRPRLESFLARQAFKRVCLAWSGWRMWQLRRAELRLRLLPVAEKTVARRNERLQAEAFAHWRQRLQRAQTFQSHLTRLVERRRQHRLMATVFSEWHVCARESQFVRSAKAAAAGAALSASRLHYRPQGASSAPPRARRPGGTRGSSYEGGQEKRLKASNRSSSASALGSSLSSVSTPRQVSSRASSISREVSRRASASSSVRGSAGPETGERQFRTARDGQRRGRSHLRSSLALGKSRGMSLRTSHAEQSALATSSQSMSPSSRLESSVLKDERQGDVTALRSFPASSASIATRDASGGQSLHGRLKEIRTGSSGGRQGVMEVGGDSVVQNETSEALGGAKPREPRIEGPMVATLGGESEIFREERHQHLESSQLSVERVLYDSGDDEDGGASLISTPERGRTRYVQRRASSVLRIGPSRSESQATMTSDRTREGASRSSSSVSSSVLGRHYDRKHERMESVFARRSVDSEFLETDLAWSRNDGPGRLQQPVERRGEETESVHEVEEQAEEEPYYASTNDERPKARANQAAEGRVSSEMVTAEVQAPRVPLLNEAGLQLAGRGVEEIAGFHSRVSPANGTRRNGNDLSIHVEQKHAPDTSQGERQDGGPRRAARAVSATAGARGLHDSWRRYGSDSGPASASPRPRDSSSRLIRSSMSRHASPGLRRARRTSRSLSHSGEVVDAAAVPTRPLVSLSLAASSLLKTLEDEKAPSRTVAARATALLRAFPDSPPRAGYSFSPSVDEERSSDLPISPSSAIEGVRRESSAGSSSSPSSSVSFPEERTPHSSQTGPREPHELKKLPRSRSRAFPFSRRRSRVKAKNRVKVREGDVGPPGRPSTAGRKHSVSGGSSVGGERRTSGAVAAVLETNDTKGRNRAAIRRRSPAVLARRHSEPESSHSSLSDPPRSTAQGEAQGEEGEQEIQDNFVHVRGGLIESTIAGSTNRSGGYPNARESGTETEREAPSRVMNGESSVRQERLSAEEDRASPTQKPNHPFFFSLLSPPPSSLGDEQQSPVSKSIRASSLSSSAESSFSMPGSSRSGARGENKESTVHRNTPHRPKGDSRDMSPRLLHASRDAAGETSKSRKSALLAGDNRDDSPNLGSRLGSLTFSRSQEKDLIPSSEAGGVEDLDLRLRRLVERAGGSQTGSSRRSSTVFSPLKVSLGRGTHSEKIGQLARVNLDESGADSHFSTQRTSAEGRAHLSGVSDPAGDSRKSKDEWLRSSFITSESSENHVVPALSRGRQDDDRRQDAPRWDRSLLFTNDFKEGQMERSNEDHTAATDRADDDDGSQSGPGETRLPKTGSREYHENLSMASSTLSSSLLLSDLAPLPQQHEQGILVDSSNSGASSTLVSPAASFVRNRGPYSLDVLSAGHHLSSDASRFRLPVGPYSTPELPGDRPEGGESVFSRNILPRPRPLSLSSDMRPQTVRSMWVNRLSPLEEGESVAESSPSSPSPGGVRPSSVTTSRTPRGEIPRAAVSAAIGSLEAVSSDSPPVTTFALDGRTAAQHFPSDQTGRPASEYDMSEATFVSSRFGRSHLEEVAALSTGRLLQNPSAEQTPLFLEGPPRHLPQARSPTAAADMRSPSSTPPGMLPSVLSPARPGASATSVTVSPGPAESDDDVAPTEAHLHDLMVRLQRLQELRNSQGGVLDSAPSSVTPRSQRGGSPVTPHSPLLHEQPRERNSDDDSSDAVRRDTSPDHLRVGGHLSAGDRRDLSGARTLKGNMPSRGASGSQAESTPSPDSARNSRNLSRNVANSEGALLKEAAGIQVSESSSKKHSYPLYQNTSMLLEASGSSIASSSATSPVVQQRRGLSPLLGSSVLLSPSALLEPHREGDRAEQHFESGSSLGASSRSPSSSSVAEHEEKRIRRKMNDQQDSRGAVVGRSKSAPVREKVLRSSAGHSSHRVDEAPEGLSGGGDDETPRLQRKERVPHGRFTPEEDPPVQETSDGSENSGRGEDRNSRRNLGEFQISGRTRSGNLKVRRPRGGRPALLADKPAGRDTSVVKFRRRAREGRQRPSATRRDRRERTEESELEGEGHQTTASNAGGNSREDERASVAASEDLLQEAWKEATEETRHALLKIHREVKLFSSMEEKKENFDPL